MIWIIATIAALALAGGLTTALYVETSRTFTLLAEVDALHAEAAQLRYEHDVHLRQKAVVISQLTKENKALWAELATTRLQRDIRPPADPIIEHLAVNGPTDIAELITIFGRYVGRRLGQLATESDIVECDLDHNVWWVDSPAEARGRQTRVVEAMADPSESHERPQEAPGDVPEWVVASVTPDDVSKGFTVLGEAGYEETRPLSKWVTS